MKLHHATRIVLLFLFIIQVDVLSQDEPISSATGDNWGYSYDSTLTYLNEISQNQYVQLDSIGASVEGRAIWIVNISQDNQHPDPMFRVAIHARTHPNEVQSQWLTQKIIDILIGDSDLAKILRRRVIFNIVPMYNPDGVELELTRYNANGVDLERNWFVENPEPECAALNNKYYELMSSLVPISIMLNMHGDNGAEKAYFYFHHENGTSLDYTEIQKQFISLVRQYFIDGISNWDYSITWSGGNPMLFPESWFWVNYQEDVLAITFEEIPVESRFDSLLHETATALLNGIVDYLDIRTIVSLDESTELLSVRLEQNYPNPFNPSTSIEYTIPADEFVSLKVYDILGNEVANLVNELKEAGHYKVQFNAANLASGLYIYKFQTGKFAKIRKMLFLK